MATVKKEKFRYFKLATKASTFVDPKSGLYIVNDQVVKANHRKVKSSKTVDAALDGGHIKEVDEDEYDEYMKSLSPKAKKAIQEKEEAEEDTLKAKEEKRQEAKEEKEEEDEDEDENEDTGEDETKKASKKKGGKGNKTK